MSKIIFLMLSIGVVAFFSGSENVNADNQTIIGKGSQIINDEGYGNEDAEYYNSEDDMVNDEENSVPQENVSTGTQ